MVKQVIILRKDLNMSTGKCVAQGAHASMLAYNQACHMDDDRVKHFEAICEWGRTGDTKIILACNSLTAITKLMNMALNKGLPCAIVVDEGRTEVEPGSVTALGIGPADAEEIDAITKRLRLY